MKFLIIASKTSIFIKFRLDLVKQILNKGHQVVVVSPEEDTSGCLHNLGVRLITPPLNKASISIFDSLRYFFYLVRILKKEKPDKVFCYNVKPVIFGCIASKMAKVPEIYPMITGLGYIYSDTTFKLKILQFLAGIGYKLAFKFSSKVIFQNSDDIFEFSTKRKYLNIEKCKIVNGSGVNMIEFPKSKLPSNISFLMVSRLLTLKGIIEYFEAAKIVKNKFPNVTFTFVGASDNSPLSFNINDYYDKYINSGIIDFHHNSNNVKNFLKNCSVFVLPSYYREGIPRALLEAMAVGRPLITTNTAGCKETINTNKNGFLIRAKDVDDLVEKMIYFIEHPDEINSMANESYNYCKSKFDVNLVNKQMLEIFNI